MMDSFGIFGSYLVSQEGSVKFSYKDEGLPILPFYSNTLVFHRSHTERIEFYINKWKK